MTSNRIYRGSTGEYVTKTTGYLNTPGTSVSYGQYTRTALASLTTLMFTARVRFTTLGTTSPFGGWAGATASILIGSTGRIQMYCRNTDGTALGNVASLPVPGLAPNTWIWLRGRVTGTSALTEYWYAFDHTDWLPLGVFDGNESGFPLAPTGSQNLLIGSRGTTPYVANRIDYFEEHVNGVRTYIMDLQNVTTLPAATSLVGSATFVPRTTYEGVVEMKQVWRDGKMIWPPTVADPNPLNIYKGSTHLWPKAGGKAKWGVTQWSDGTKFA